MNVPGWFKVFAVALAGLMGAALSVPYRWVRAPKSSGSDQPRAHFNTKSTTRFVGTDLTEPASPVATPSTQAPRRQIRPTW